MIYVTYDSYCISSEYSDEEYGDWQQDNSFEVASAHLTLPRNAGGSYEQFELDVQEGDEIFAVYVRYGSGDSFGSSTGNGSIIAAYTDIEHARIAVSNFEKNSSGMQVSIPAGVDMTGKLTYTKVYNPAAGYFENLETVDFERLVVKK